MTNRARCAGRAGDPVPHGPRTGAARCPPGPRYRTSPRREHGVPAGPAPGVVPRAAGPGLDTAPPARRPYAAARATADRDPGGGVQRRRHAGAGPRSHPDRLPVAHLGHPRQRRPQRRRHLPGRPRLPAARPVPAPRGGAQPPQPGLRRQPEGRLPVGDRAGARHHRHAARRRSVRAREAARHGRPARAGRGRRRVRVPHAREGCRPPGRHAALQVRRQQGAHPVRERPGRHRPVRVALGLPGLLRRRPARPALRAQRRRLQLRHADHRAARRVGEAHRRDPHPHLLRGRDLLRERGQVRPPDHPRRRPLPGAQDGLRHR